MTLRVGAITQDDLDEALEPEPRARAPDPMRPEPELPRPADDRAGEWRDVSTTEQPSDGASTTQ